MRVSGGGYGGSMHNRMRRSENVISFIARSHFPNDIRSHRVPQRYCKPMLLPLYAIICTLLETRDTAQTEVDGKTCRRTEGRARRDYYCILYMYTVYHSIAKAVCARCFDLLFHCKQIRNKRRHRTRWKSERDENMCS